MSASYPPTTLKPSLALKTGEHLNPNSPQLPSSSNQTWTSSSESNGFTLSPSFDSPLSHSIPVNDFPPQIENKNSNKKNNNNNKLNSKKASSSSVPASSYKAIFSQLEMIKSLQKDIASTHSTLEGIGSSKQQSSWYSKQSSTSTEDEKEGIKLSYSAMSYEFEERQNGVEEILSKLSLLSTAIKTFHSLPAPPLFSEDLSSSLEDSTGRSTTITPENILPVSSNLESRPSNYGRRLSFN